MATVPSRHRELNAVSCASHTSHPISYNLGHYRFPSLSNSSIQHPTNEILRLIQKSSEHSHPVFNQQQLTKLKHFTNLSLKLLTYNSELTPQYQFNPTQPLPLDAITL